MLTITGLSHVCVNVDDIDAALTYYQDLLSAKPLQIFPHFRNEGFSRDAGFGEDWDSVDVSIAFMDLPGSCLTLELMQYHGPHSRRIEFELATTDRGRLGHIALKVGDIDQAFAHVKAMPDTRFISEAPDYLSVSISSITPAAFRFFDAAAEGDVAEKQKVADIISSIRFFYFIDRYGIQWECEQGHHDIGTPTE
ncbi:MAG: VOC family protein [Pseudomonadota bacterium]